jgi:hypothetical protein
VGGVITTSVLLVLVRRVIVVRKRSSASFLAWWRVGVLVLAKLVPELLVAVLLCGQLSPEGEVFSTSRNELKPKSRLVSGEFAYAH